MNQADLKELMSVLPADTGTYVLNLHLSRQVQLTIGRLGQTDFRAGYYTYVGSAFAPGGLRGRLKHHLKPVKKPHWHIDYLRLAAPLYEVWYAAHPTVYEHTWADMLRSLPGTKIPMPRFGASDCNCQTHLVYFQNRPRIDLFRERSDTAVQCWQIVD